MKAVILGKASSIRVKEKNYRPFYEGKSLADILLEKLVKVLPRKDIFLSCENEKYRTVAEKWGINFLLRDEKYTKIGTNNADVFKYVYNSIPGKQDDVLFVTSTEPMFDEFDEIINLWNVLNKDEHDSLNIVYPIRKHFLDANRNPIGFGFGRWHKYSQQLLPIFQVSWAIAIVSKKCIDNCSYIIGENPYWYDSYGISIDIDTEPDWDLAKNIYKHHIENTKEIKNISNANILLIKNDKKDIDLILRKVKKKLFDAKISLGAGCELTLYHHYGFKHFYDFGAAVIDVINREYCKKIFVLLPGQKYPMHFHKQKEETYHILYGIMHLEKENHKLNLKEGQVITIERGISHAFSSVNGCIFEEISTTYLQNDSFYRDEEILILPTNNRKTTFNKWQ